MDFRQGMLAGAAMLGAAAFAGAAAAEPCVQDTFESEAYVVCTVEKGSDLRLFWKSADGEPYRDFSGVAEAIKKSGQSLVFAVNAGMYLTDFSPIGL